MYDIIDIIWHLKWVTQHDRVDKFWALTVIKLVFNGLCFIFPFPPLSHLCQLNQTKNSERETKNNPQSKKGGGLRSTLVLPKPSVIMHCRIWNIANTKMNICSWWIPYAETKATFPCKAKTTHHNYNYIKYQKLKIS